MPKGFNEIKGPQFFVNSRPFPSQNLQAEMGLVGYVSSPRAPLYNRGQKVSFLVRNFNFCKTALRGVGKIPVGESLKFCYGCGSPFLWFPAIIIISQVGLRHGRPPAKKIPPSKPVAPFNPRFGPTFFPVESGKILFFLLA